MFMILSLCVRAISSAFHEDVPAGSELASVTLQPLNIAYRGWANAVKLRIQR